MIHYSRRKLAEMTVDALCYALAKSMLSDSGGKYPDPRVVELQSDFDAALTRAVQNELGYQSRVISEAELAASVYETAEKVAVEIEEAKLKRVAQPRAAVPRPAPKKSVPAVVPKKLRQNKPNAGQRLPDPGPTPEPPKADAPIVLPALPDPLPDPLLSGQGEGGE